MYAISFDGSWAKIERAEQHRVLLHDYIREVAENPANRAVLSAKLNPKTGYHTFRVHSMPLLAREQERVALMVGDVIQNLRAALDHLVYQLVMFNTNGTPKSPNSAQFPLSARERYFASNHTNRNGAIKEVHRDHRAVIERHQPYKRRGNRPDTWSGPYVHPLGLLRDLSNADKHRVLTTTIPVPAVYNMLVHEEWPEFPRTEAERVAYFDKFRRRNSGLTYALKPGAKVHRARLVETSLAGGIQPYMHVVGYAAPRIALEHRRPANETLERIAAYVVKVIREFEEMFYPESPSGHRAPPDDGA